MCAPEETLERIRPAFADVGLTRLADVTWLDEIGIPVVQAIRPNGKLLSVSQGKGLTKAAAAVSAAMEAIESWHAENLPQGEVRASLFEMQGSIGYRVDSLQLPDRHSLNAHRRLEWTAAWRIRDGQETFVPSGYLRLDSRVASRYMPPLFDSSSNGLASGNTFDEATLHALYELIERDAQVESLLGAGPKTLIPETIDGNAGELWARFRDADVHVTAAYLPSPTAVPCYMAKIWSDLFPVFFAGSGCHLDRDVALCRALTEAAQSRITAIAGTRDDMTRQQYDDARLHQRTFGGTPTHQLPEGSEDFQATPSISQYLLADDLALVVDQIEQATEQPVFVADLTRPEIGIPVARAFGPGLRYDPEFPF
nr:YcaO-like family protein [Nocardia sp.]